MNRRSASLIIKGIHLKMEKNPHPRFGFSTFLNLLHALNSRNFGNTHEGLAKQVSNHHYGNSASRCDASALTYRTSYLVTFHTVSQFENSESHDCAIIYSFQ